MTALALLRSPIGRYGAIALAVLALVGVIYARGYGAGIARCHTEALEAALAAAEEQRAIADRAAADAAARAEALAVEAQAMQEIVDDQREALALADDACTWQPDQLERVRRLLDGAGG
ncbi:MAG: hypothetical protein VW338_00920 [Rhodospirillaceae bacterium]